MHTLWEVVTKIMQNNVFVEKSSDILVLTDDSTKALGNKFKEALISDCWKATIHIMEDRTKSGEEPPGETAKAMLDYHLVFCLTKYSLTHTAARKNANADNVSVITMPGITEDMFLKGAMSADYSIVEKETKEKANQLSKANKVVITTSNKYTLTVPVEGRKGIASTGVFREKASSGNLPSGEAFIAPVEGYAEGEIEINGSIAGIGLLEEPVLLTIEKGRLVYASGKIGDRLLTILGDGKGRLLAELGIGTNHAARLTGHILEDEKAYNTVHVAFGSNHTFGGTIKADVHIDCVTSAPLLNWAF